MKKCEPVSYTHLVGREVLARFLERRCHADDAGEVLGARPLAALLGAAGDEWRDGKEMCIRDRGVFVFVLGMQIVYGVSRRLNTANLSDRENAETVSQDVYKRQSKTCPGRCARAIELRSGHAVNSVCLLYTSRCV